MFFFLFVVDQIFSRLYLGIHRFLFLDTEVWKNMFYFFPTTSVLKGGGVTNKRNFFLFYHFLHRGVFPWNSCLPMPLLRLEQTSQGVDDVTGR